MDFRRLLFDKQEGIGICTLNRPESLNALDAIAYEELRLLFKRIQDDETTKVLIITGAGKAFCSGTDVGGIESQEVFGGVSMQLGLRSIGRMIEKTPKPVIAALNGYTLGGGLELALCCDFRTASENAVLGFPEIDLGIMPGAGGTQRLPRLIGIARAKRMIFLGERVSAKQAESIGLVDIVVEPHKLMESTLSFAKVLESKPPIALAICKAATNRMWEGDSLENGLRYEYEAGHLITDTDDAKEGTRAFTEKRKPVWKGR